MITFSVPVFDVLRSLTGDTNLVSKEAKSKVEINQVKKKRMKIGSKSPAIIKTALEHPELTLAEIRKLHDCTDVNVINTLKRYGIERETVRDFIDAEKYIRADVKRLLLTSISEDEIKKMSVHNRVVDYGILVDKDRDESKAGGDIKVVINIGDPTKVIEVEATPS